MVIVPQMDKSEWELIRNNVSSNAPLQPDLVLAIISNTRKLKRASHALAEVLRTAYGPAITEVQAEALLTACRQADLLDAANEWDLSILIQVDGTISCAWHEVCDALTFDGKRWTGRVPVKRKRNQHSGGHL